MENINYLTNYFKLNEQYFTIDLYQFSENDIESLIEVVKNNTENIIIPYNNDYYTLLGMYYLRHKNYDYSKKYFSIGVELSNIRSMYMLARYYENIEYNPNLVGKYYKLAIELDDTISMYSYACFCENNLKNIKEAKKYYIMGSDMNDSNSLFNLANIFKNTDNNIKLYRIFLQKAVNLHDIRATHNLGMYYIETGQPIKGINLLEMCCQKMSKLSMLVLAKYYKTIDKSKSEEYYFSAKIMESYSFLRNYRS